MPRGDRTGPNGLGPMTGRAAGHCAGFSVPGFTNFFTGRRGGGRGPGRLGGGRGRGFRYMHCATDLPGWTGRQNWYTGWAGEADAAALYGIPPLNPEQEAEALKNQARIMQENLQVLNDRIDELEKNKVKKSTP